MARSQALRDALRVKPGSRIHLERMDAGATFGHDKESSVAATLQQMERLRSLQDRMWAEAKHSVLVVLQGIDAAGKDGTIAKVMEAFNPQGCPVTSFKVPTPEELGHDFLWRVHRHTPRKGEVGIFNRSHYEDVLVVRVHGLVPRKVWSAPLRPDQRLRGDADRRTARPSSSSSCRSTATSSASGSRSASTTRRSAGSSAWATSRSASSGTTTRRPSTMP